MNAPTRMTDEELQRIAELLESDAMPDTAVDLPTLEGFITGMVVGPAEVPLWHWLPWVWDFDTGQCEPAFADETQHKEALDLVFGLWAHTYTTFDSSPESFRPTFLRRDDWRAESWCDGFLAATMMFQPDLWERFWTVDAECSEEDPSRVPWRTPFSKLGDAAFAGSVMDEEERQRWVDAIVPSLLSINAHWAEVRPMVLDAAYGYQKPIRREAPKVGRNDPCPCGSGRKFKKCCLHGAPETDDGPS